MSRHWLLTEPSVNCMKNGSWPQAVRSGWSFDTESRSWNESSKMYEKHFGFSERPFNLTPDPRFFFVNPCYQEAYATLRYGVECRKGFVVVTGDAGTGKTTLLRRLMQKCESNIHTAYIFNTGVGFAELLRLAMTDLGSPPSSADKAAMIAQFNEYLIRRLEKGEFVCLLIDEAQNLRDEVLEEFRLLSNLETNEEKLLQIVLMGQPELERKLDQPKLAQLKQRIALRCRLRPLQRQEVGSYIEVRLATVAYTGKEVFSPESVERIAIYSHGIPRLINVICDNALLAACGASNGRVSPRIIEEVAHDLNLSGRLEEAGPIQPSVRDLRRAVGEDTFRPRAEQVFRTNPVPPETALEFQVPSRKAGRQGRSTRVLLTGCLLVVGGIALYSQRGAQIQPVLNRYAEKLVRIAAQNGIVLPGRLSGEAGGQHRPAAQDGGRPVLERTAPPSETGRESPPLAATKSETARGLDPRRESGNIAGLESRNEAKNTRTAGPPVAGEDVASRRDLEIQIYQAIHRRAISGVDVYVDGGTAYLGGRVATRSQKLAAVRAARGVPGVQHVRDRIVVEW
jgi:general secretion pathway protein A